MADIDSPWEPYRKEVKEYELPYSPEAWAGIQRYVSGST